MNPFLPAPRRSIFIPVIAVIGEEELVERFNRRATWSDWCFRRISQGRLDIGGRKTCWETVANVSVKDHQNSPDEQWSLEVTERGSAI
jgi:hypothetical protein